jgi:hypothetical protein
MNQEIYRDKIFQAEALAGEAWNNIKDPNDPEWSGCQKTHRENFAHLALSIIKGGRAESPFEKEVERLLQGVWIARASAPPPPLVDSPDAPYHVKEAIAAQKYVDESLANFKKVADGADLSSGLPGVENVPQSNTPPLESEAASSQKASTKTARKSKAKPHTAKVAAKKAKKASK